MNTEMPQPRVYIHLDAQFANLGTRLFTVTCHDETAGLYHRTYSSNPTTYPAGGTKPLTHDAWYGLCVAARKPFVANTPVAFSEYFFDHAIITALNLGSCITIPVASTSQVLGTLNLLAEPHHFTPEKLTCYMAIVAQHHTALTTAMTPG